MKINFINKVRFALSKEIKEDLRNTVRKISVFESKRIYSVNLIFCDDVLIREYNREFLGHDYETDIITFHDENENGETEGELLISIDTVSENAEFYKIEFETELKRVVIHGVLHLCGYKDKTYKQKELMIKKENLYLKTK
ncbi:MAG TPA: rRNA maturation RNase YbeY [Ignavibacteria bacterium]|nr:rRNA maturation RNase YbeY [Ignavibacteria bacterium]